MRCYKQYFIKINKEWSPELLKCKSKYNLEDEVCQIIANRKITNISNFLSDNSIPDLTDEILNLKEAAQIIKSAISDNKKIRCLTDYDVDGITSTVISVKALKYIGADVSYDIPDRHTDGYGLNIRLVEEAIKDGIDVIVTFDNGIAAGEAVKFAKEKGLTVIVTDHHEVPFTMEGNEKKYLLPEADIIVNPKQPDDKSEFKEICGAMIAYQLTRVLIPDIDNNPINREFIEMATLGTVCDVMPLVELNRTLVKRGLKIIEEGCNPAIMKLKEIYNISDKKIMTYHIGFIIGPTLNAAGRLGSAKESVDFLLETDVNKIEEKAYALKEINDERKNLTDAGVKVALEYADSRVNDKVLIIPMINTEESICGIIAGRIKETYNKPTLVLSLNYDTGIAKGSGRSIEAFNMFEEFSKYKNLFSAFGGHKMACGISLPIENILKFEEIVNTESTLEPKDFVKNVSIDVRIPLHLTGQSLVDSISLLEPFGTGNPAPIIADKNVIIESARIIGANQNTVSLSLKTEKGFKIKGMFFNGVTEFKDMIDSKFGNSTADKILRNELQAKVDIIYNPSVNTWNGTTFPQAIIKEII